MGTLKQKLDYIKETKQLIGDAITAKGGTVTNNFREYATAITNLPSGGGSCTAGVCFDDAGYDYNEACLVKMREDLKYAKKLLDEWNPADGLYFLYSNDRNLVYAPKIDFSKVDSKYMTNTFDSCTSLIMVPFYDTSKIVNMKMAFYNCSSLSTIPAFDTSSVTSMADVFSRCTSLKEIPLLDTSKVRSMSNTFQGCSSLSTIPAFDTSSVTSMDNTFDGCTSLKEIPALNTENVKNLNTFNGYGIEFFKVGGLSLKSATDLSYTFSGFGDSPVQYMLLKDLGTPEAVTNYDFSKQAKWGSEAPVKGVDVTGASQTVVDSLLTYSFDRKAAGYAVCNLKCHANMKQYLTEEQITAIQNKGYTITF